VAFGFTGKEFDEETGLYYFGARYYDARTSVWVSADPILGAYLGGKAGMGGVYNSFNLGLYSYGHLNPVKFVDPDGKAAGGDPTKRRAKELRQLIRGVNPTHSDINCIASVIATDKTLHTGKTVQAEEQTGGLYFWTEKSTDETTGKDIEKTFYRATSFLELESLKNELLQATGNKPKSASGKNVADVLNALPDNTQGIAIGSDTGKAGYGHAFNYKKENGQVYLIDGQSGDVEAFNGKYLKNSSSFGWEKYEFTQTQANTQIDKPMNAVDIYIKKLD
jgi:RHS repeat-associated protein